MEKEGNQSKKQANTNYWLEGFLGSIGTALLYTIVKVANKGKPTVKGVVASGMIGGVGTPLAVWGVPKLIEMEKQAQASSSFRQVTTASYPQLLAGSITEQESTATKYFN
jgi:putative effector of murein hydrolase